MGRLINTADINNVLMREKDKYGKLANTVSEIVETIIEKVPTAVIRDERKGRWIELAYEFCSDCSVFSVYECSECRYRCSGYKYVRKPYCPNCGARMAESEDSGKINCKTTKCENCKNHNYCDYEPQESEDKE